VSGSIHIAGEIPCCHGRHLILGHKPGEAEGSAELSAGHVGLELATILAEKEAGKKSKKAASGEAQIPVITLLVRRESDASETGWVAHALPWIARHGRRVILRTRKVLDRGLVDLAVAGLATIELELAHHKAQLQTALLGPGAESASALLLHAQHLAAVGLPVVARLEPMMPGIHDEERTFEHLARNVVAADVIDAHVEVGRLLGAQIDALLNTPRVLGPGMVLRLGRAYGLPPQELLTRETPGPWQLRPQTAAGLRHNFENLARDVGLRIDACGCAAHCQLDAAERDYVPVAGPDLFHRAGLGRVG
jgi:hypothetical protein